MVYPQDFESKIGFDTIRNTIARLCSSRLSRDIAAEMSFSTDFGHVMHSLRSVRDMMAIRSSELPFPALSSHDVIPYLAEIRAVNSFMSADRLYKLLQTLVSFAEVRAFFDSCADGDSDVSHYPDLRMDAEVLMQFPHLARVISNAIDKFGEVKDTASPALYEVRQSIRRATGLMQRAMRRVMDCRQGRVSCNQGRQNGDTGGCRSETSDQRHCAR